MQNRILSIDLRSFPEAFVHTSICIGTHAWVRTRAHTHRERELSLFSRQVAITRNISDTACLSKLWCQQAMQVVAHADTWPLLA